MISVFARKSLYLIAIAAIGMSAFQLAGATTTTEGPTGSAYPSESAYPTDSPTESSYPSTSPVASTDEPTVSPTSFSTSATTAEPTLPSFSVDVSLRACPAECSSIEAAAANPDFLNIMTACFNPFVISKALLRSLTACSLCEDALAGRRARILQNGPTPTGGVGLSFEFSSEDPNFTEAAAAQAFADNLADLPELAEALQSGLTIDPTTVDVGGTQVATLTGAPTMSPTKGPKDSKKKKKDKSDKKKKDKSDKKSKKDKPDDDDDDDDMDKKTGKKKGKKDKKDKSDKKDKKTKR